MNSELDKKLELIVNNSMIGVLGRTKDDRIIYAIEQIKTAFSEAGYIDKQLLPNGKGISPNLWAKYTNLMLEESARLTEADNE